jgi:hypothetical protein
MGADEFKQRSKRIEVLKLDVVFADDLLRTNSSHKALQRDSLSTESTGAETDTQSEPSAQQEGKEVYFSPFKVDANRKLRKKVSFAEDEYGNVLCQRDSGESPLSPDVKEEEVWYTNDQFLVLKKICKQEASLTKSAETEYVKNFRKVYDSCKTSQGLYDLKRHECVELSISRFRGLENFIFTSTLHKNRRTIIKCVVLTQARLPADMSQEDRQLKLAATSKALSRQPRRIARVLGVCDDAAVRILDGHGREEAPLVEI